MLLRVLSFLVALALVWNGLAAQELPNVSRAAAETSADEVSRSVTPGSIEDHRLDDQPQQAHAEPLVDTTALFFGTWVPVPPAQRAAAPRHPATTALPWPWLDGPHRPPRVLASA